jgi:hypothetical protein
MSRNRYLTAENSARDTYASGELHLDATKTKMKHAYAIYPPPFDKLTNFILEGEIKFAKNGNKSNRAEIAFRANKPYFHSDGYILYINNDGGYRVDIRRDGAGFPVAEFSSSPILNRGVTAENTFKIVAYGSLFDIYINDKLLLGFEHEMFDRGTIWLLVLKGGYATFDNIKVWEATLK